MLERAGQRVRAAGIDSVTVWQVDLRDAELPRESYDVILAAAVRDLKRSTANCSEVSCRFGSHIPSLSGALSCNR